MRLVLDTNVVLSALLWRGTPYHLFSMITQQSRVQLYSSLALLEELADVLGRPSATKRLALISRSAREILTDYVKAVELVEPISVPRVVHDDEDDDQVIAAALTAYADFIVSGDRHLLNLESFQGIEIVSAAVAMTRIKNDS